MNSNIQQYVPGDFAGNSRVWIYQSSRMFSMQEALQVETLLEEFTSQWTSHGAAVKGAGLLLFGQFIILLADESAAGVSGCSTDSSVRIIKQIENAFGVNLFDRTTLAFWVKDKVQLLPLGQLSYAVENGFINADTIYFNNLVQTKDELLQQWMIPAGESWLKNRVKWEKQVS